MSPVLRHRLFVASVVIAITLSGYAGFRLWQWQQPPRIMQGAVMKPCDLNDAPCEAIFPGGGRMQVSISPRPIPLVTPIAVEVQLTGLSADSVQVDFNSLDMNMGFNRHQLERQNGRRFAGHTVLPVCVRDRMTWQLQTTADTAHGPLGAVFEFETVVARDLRR
jgi:hypothetical protein